MTRQLVVAEPDEELSEAMATMLQADIKHLPVVSEGRIVGILTLAALVRRQIGNLTAELHYLQDYISDLHEAGRD
jgi:IMP dehydrogenase